MAIPMPPTVYGPVTPLSPNVRVTGVLPQAVVTILENGAPIGHATATNPGELLVPLTIAPTPGRSITASQVDTGVTSQASSQSITVVAVPVPLPVPAILSALNTCMVDIYADGLVPGAKVITTISGAAFGTITAGETTSWLGINPATPIAAQALAQVHQQATVNGTPQVGAAVSSPPIPAFVTTTDLLPPPVLGPLVQCVTTRDFETVVPGAGTTITNMGQSEHWVNVSAAFSGYGGPPLRQGTATALQEMPRCGHRSATATLTVAPAKTPAAPIVTQPVCPQALVLTVSGLVPGGILHVRRRVVQSPSVTDFQNLGDVGIQYSTQTVDLPASLTLTDPLGPVSISLSQECCGGVSPATNVAVAPAGGPFAPPKIDGELVDCSRGIPISGAHPGSIVQAFNTVGGAPLSDPVGVTQPAFVLNPWFPLVTGQHVQVRQVGCNAAGSSQTVVVVAAPNPLPVPVIKGPVHPAATGINVSGVVPGARLYLLVNGQLRPGSVYIYDTTGVVPVTGAPLKAASPGATADVVLVIQKICAESSTTDVRGVQVTVGTMKLTVSPAHVTRGQQTSVTVTAADAANGDAVTGQVLLNNHPVGTTGTAFTYTPGLADPNPTGLVEDSPAYANANFTIDLVNPPPPPPPEPPPAPPEPPPPPEPPAPPAPEPPAPEAPPPPPEPPPPPAPPPSP
jgi:hypothetical protein